MSPDLVRKLDRRLGPPICWLLSLCKGVLVRRRIERDGVPRKVLFVKLVEQGSTVVAAAAVQRAAELVGRENVFFWAFEENRFIVDAMELVPEENVFVIRGDDLGTFVRDCLRSIREVRRAEIDVTIDLEGFARASVILATLSGARQRVGLDRYTSEGPYRGDLLTHRVQYNPYLHTGQTFLSLVEALAAPAGQVPLLKRGMPAITEVPRFRSEPGERDRVQAKLDELVVGEVSRPVLLLNPNASDLMPLRRWATERFIELGKRLLEVHDSATVFITGAPSEQDAAERLAWDIHPTRAICLAGHTTLRELLVVYGLADVLVTNDSGPAHFAALTDIHIVSLFGPETPLLYGPLSPRNRSLTAGLACSPCVNVFNHRDSPCRDNVCMQAITVDEVLAAVNAALAERELRR